jgi:hypothetical protein
MTVMAGAGVSTMPSPEAVMVGMVGKALLSISPSAFAVASAVMMAASWMNAASSMSWQCIATSLLILAALPFRQSALYHMLIQTNAKSIDDYVSRGIPGFPNKAVSFYDRVKVLHCQMYLELFHMLVVVVVTGS